MDKLIFGLTVTVIGIAVVFCGLVVLIGLIKLVAMATGSASRPRKEKAAPVPAPAPVPVPAPAAPVAQEQPVQADDTLIAVISAAVAAMMEDGSAFTVRRIRRVSNATAWSRAGREEQVYSRF